MPNDDFQPENCWLIKNFENWATHFLSRLMLSPLPGTRSAEKSNAGEKIYVKHETLHCSAVEVPIPSRLSIPSGDKIMAKEVHAGILFIRTIP